MKHLLLCGVVCSTVFASSPSVESPVTLTPLSVEAEGGASQPPLSPASTWIAESSQELSNTLSTLPGVHLRQLGCHAGEPVFRGLGWERVATQYNGLNLHGACPSRMDPPVNLFSASELDSVSIELGPASVTRGPVPLGGRILLEDSLTLAPESETRKTADLSLTGASNGDALSAGVSAEHATDARAFRVEGSKTSSGDYETGNGTEVQANYESEKAGAFYTQRLADDLILELGTRWIYNQDIDFLALPMDSRYEKTNLTTGSLQWLPQGDSLQELRIRAGYGTVDHLMDNRDKANRRMVEASTPSEATSGHVGVLSAWRIGNGELRTGFDASQLERDALRTRTMVMMGRTFQDPIWPDLEQDQVGLYGEWEQSLSETTSLRAGVRVDWYEQDAGKADAKIVPGPGVGMTTVAKAWEEVGGSDPGVVATEDTPISGNLILQQDLSEDWSMQIGLSRVEAVPNLTQRYLSFGPVPGGFGIGTPSLDPEEKWEIELRTEGRVDGHLLGAALFAARVNDYLLPTTVAMLDVNGDGRVDRVKGTVNEDAELYGAEASAVLFLGEEWILPLSAAFVRGEVSESGTPLPEIPPLDVRAALRWQEPEEQKMFVEFGMHFAARQDRIDPAFGEDETPSFAVFHLRGGVQLSPVWRLEAGVENLFDREYHEHLTREVLLPEGGLAAGDEVSAPGRSFHLALKSQW